MILAQRDESFDETYIGGKSDAIAHDGARDDGFPSGGAVGAMQMLLEREFGGDPGPATLGAKLEREFGLDWDDPVSFMPTPRRTRSRFSRIVSVLAGR